ncbi:MAG: LysM peptidoglycan-binding domain-containing protein [Clostridia bacterium]
MRNKLIKGLAILGVSAVLTFYPGTHALADYNTYVTHTVVSGESLWKISEKYGISLNALMTANNISRTNINIGQQLKIPVIVPDSTIEYTVKSGDVLWKIADAYKVTIRSITDLNKIDPYKQLIIGQKIYIPGPTKPAGNNTLHTVASSETIWKIGVKYGVSAQEILEANNLTESSIIYIGQKLIIPSNGETQPQVPSTNTQPYITYIEHIVQRGDIIWNLSIKYGIPQTELLKTNNLTLSSMLSVGQKLKIPVHHIPITATPGLQYGEYLDWWTQAQYVFPIGAKAKVTDFATGKSYNIVRSTGANHGDCEPLTAQDAAIMYEIWGNKWSWTERASIVEVNGRKIAASVSNMPHDIENIKEENNFKGHFDMHFRNSTRHNDGLVNQDHQAQIKIAAGVK